METNEEKRYLIRSRNGWEIESFDALDNALDCINDFESRDIYEDTYTPDFYEVYDTLKEKVIWP